MENDGMHWFWRAMISVVVSFVVMTAVNLGLARCLSVSAYSNIPLRIGLTLGGYSIPILIFGLLGRWSSSRRIPPGHCQKCGYNLTGNVSGVCPECGERI
jgi:hypothetical protein